jgi:hypothetical protein
MGRHGSGPLAKKTFQKFVYPFSINTYSRLIQKKYLEASKNYEIFT